MIIHGDFFNEVLKIEKNSIDAIITDPPYIISCHPVGETKIKSLDKLEYGLTDINTGFNIKQFFIECERILKKFNMFIFCSNKQISKIMYEGEKRGYFTTCLIWHKYNSPPFCNGVWRSDVEYIIHVREKSATFKGNTDLKSKIITQPSEVSKYGHPTEKPVNILQRFISICTNENNIILDPFAGSGSLAEACINMNRKYILIEKEKKYIDIINNRINNHVDGNLLLYEN